MQVLILKVVREGGFATPTGSGRAPAQRTQRENCRKKLGGGTHTPGVCIRVAAKGLTRQGVCKSGKQRTCKRVFCASGAGSRGLKLEVRCWKKRGWSQGRDKFRGAAHRDAEPRLDGGRTGRRVRVVAGGRWPLAKGALAKRAASRKRRCELTITAYFTACGGPAKLYEGTKMHPCTSTRRRAGNSCRNEVRR